MEFLGVHEQVVKWQVTRLEVEALSSPKTCYSVVLRLLCFDDLPDRHGGHAILLLDCVPWRRLWAFSMCLPSGSVTCSDLMNLKAHSNEVGICSRFLSKSYPSKWP